MTMKDADEVALVELFTEQHLITGRLRTGGQRLTDLLNDELYSSVQLRNVQVMRLIKLKEVIASHTSALVEKEGIMFAISRGEGDEATERSYYKRVDTVEWDVFMTIPSFELSGRLHVRGTGDLRIALLRWTGQFIPLSEAKAVFTLFPEVSFTGNVIVVNKSQIETVCVDTKLAF
jgi:hypothetical protein